MRPILAMIFVFMASTANANFISDVGGIDNFITSFNVPNSGSATEESWVESVLGADVTIDNSYSSSGSNWTLVDDAGIDDVYYLSLSSPVDYFLVKLGNGGTSIDSHYLFENIGDLAFAVVDFSVAGVDFSIRNISIDRMSHVSEFLTDTPPSGGPGTSQQNVSAPSNVLLLALGLLAFVVRKRKMLGNSI